MTERYASVAGAGVTELRLYVGNVGPWFLDATFEDEAPAVTGRVTAKVGQLELAGTVAPSYSGTFGLARKARLVAGGGGWGRLAVAKAYHNDAGVKARTVAEDAAREAGERIGSFVPPAERVGVDYVRQVGPASRVLEDLLGGVPWWVGFDGITNAGARPAVPAADGSYEVLAFDPRARVATLDVDDLRAIGIGSVISERLNAPETVRELEVVVTRENVRLVVWCGGDPNGHARGARLLRAIAQRATDGKLFGKYRYRVVSMAAGPEGRVNLQAVRKAAGLPDVLPVEEWQGVAGFHCVLTPGAEVLVEFIEGDRTMPVVTGYAGKNRPGFVPVEVAFGNGTAPVARLGDTVDVFFPPASLIEGLINGSTPFAGTLTITSAGVGIINSGRPELKS